MTKGKYAAKAKNRLANLDNEILQEKLAEITGLHSTITGLEQALDAERRDRGRLVIERADELSRSMLEEVRAQAQRQRDADYVARREVAAELAAYFSLLDNYPPLFFNEILPRLLRPEDRNRFVDEILTTAEHPSTRNARRHGADNIRRMTATAIKGDVKDGLLKTLIVDKMSAGSDVEES
ncbi:hypothetical protein [Rhodococcus jostii]|uniref:hypothetical protein n=1 Tax=Rhodococcus jostii TaxID=132919 RepID=UPI0036396723